MNEIETMYWDAFYKYLKSNPIESIFISNCSRNAVFKIERCDTLEDKNNNTYMIFCNYTPTVHDDKNLHFLRNNNIFSVKASNLEEEKVGGYSPDFTIWCSSLQFVIEIDGYNFHEKSKEQVKADKQKDRNYLKLGYIPIRFSGSEVYLNPIDCVKETLQTVFYTLTNIMYTEREHYEKAFYLGLYQGVENER